LQIRRRFGRNIMLLIIICTAVVMERIISLDQ
uniref:IS5/IS1182 family transposase n=1 Tax=Brugia timori TaxID=42155 RepID=A0A0R3R5W1_9BILA